MKTYDYVMKGTAAAGQTWQTEGTIDIASAANFPDVSHIAMVDTFGKLTQGKAVFGKPGVGCTGPYEIDQLTITRKK